MNLIVTRLCGIGLLSLSLASATLAQTRIVDSLRTVLTIERNPEKRVDILADIAYELFDFDDAMGLQYAERALKEALSINYARGIKRSYCYVGIGYVSKSDFNSAFRFYRLSDSVKSEESELLTIHNHSMIGSAFRDLSYFDSAEYYYDLALKEAQAFRNPRVLATAYKNLGLIHVTRFRNVEALEALNAGQQYLNQAADPITQIGIWNYTGKAYTNLLQYDKAMEYFTRSLQLVKSINNNYQLIECHLNLATLAMQQSKYSLALEEAFEAFELLKEYQYPPQQAEVHQRIGEIYEELGQFEMAAKYLYEALKIAEMHNLRMRTANIYSELAWTYKELANYELALDFVDRSQAIQEEINNQHGISYCCNIRGLIFLLQKRHAEAIVEFEKSKRIREVIGHIEGIAGNVFNLSLVYEDMGQLERAMALQKQAIGLERGFANNRNLGISYNAIAKH